MSSNKKLEDYPLAPSSSQQIVKNQQEEDELAQYPLAPSDDVYQNSSQSPVTALTTSALESSIPFAQSFAGAGKAAMNAITGVTGPDDYLEDYRQNRDMFARDAREAQQAYPKTAFAAGLVGGVANPLFSQSKSIKDVAAAGAIQGLGMSDADLTKGELGDATLDAILGGAAASGGYAAGEILGETAVPYAKKGLKKVGAGLSTVGKEILKKATRVVHGTPEEMTEEYLRKRGNLPTQESMSDIYDTLQTLHDERFDKLQKSKQAVNDLEKRLKDEKSSFKQYGEQQRQQLQESKKQAEYQYNNDKADYETAANEIKQGYKEVNPSPVAKTIVDAIGSLKNKVTQGSQESYGILESKNGTVSTQPAIIVLNKGIKDLKINDVAPTVQAEATINALSNLKDRLTKIGPKMSFQDAKKYLQELDQITTYSRNTGEFSSKLNETLKSLRSSVNEQLKKIPEYKNKMNEVAQNTRLLDEISSSYGNEESAIVKLNKIVSDKGQIVDLPRLKKLEEKTGVKFLQPIEEFIEAKKILNNSSLLNEINKKLPQYAKFKNSEDFLKHINSQLDNLKKNLNQSEQKQSVDRTQQLLNDEILGLHIAETDYDPVSFLKNDKASKVKKLITGKPEIVSSFENLDKATGLNLRDQIRNRAILDQFEYDNTRGSRNVQVFRTLFKGAAYALIGNKLGGELGSMIGSGIGMTMDKYSGKVMQSLLDNAISVREGADALAAYYGKYAGPIAQAASKGPQALAATFSVLSKDPEFKRVVGIQRNKQ
jgi:hypothetical protein